MTNKVIHVTQIDNGWLVGYQTTESSPILTPQGTQMQHQQVPHAEFCKGPSEVAARVQALCVDAQSDDAANPVIINLMFKDLIEYDNLEECSTDMFGFSGVTFKRDFGPWKASQKVQSLWFDINETSHVKEMSEDGETLNECDFQLTAI